MNSSLLAIPLAYLLGSIPFGYLLVRIFRKEDIRASGSGNIGATNVARTGGKWLGILTLLLDCLKGVAAVLLACLIAKHVRSFHLLAPFGSAQAYQIACMAAVFATLGHVFPVWLGFRGGKGVATALGVFLVLAPLAILAALVVFLSIFALTRFVSLASVLASAVIPFAYVLLIDNRGPWPVAAFVGIPLLVIFKHHANIRRLLAGTESRFGSRATHKAVA